MSILKNCLLGSGCSEKDRNFGNKKIEDGILAIEFWSFQIFCEWSVLPSINKTKYELPPRVGGKMKWYYYTTPSTLLSTWKLPAKSPFSGELGTISASSKKVRNVPQPPGDGYCSPYGNCSVISRRQVITCSTEKKDKHWLIQCVRHMLKFLLDVEKATDRICRRELFKEFTCRGTTILKHCLAGVHQQKAWSECRGGFLISFNLITPFAK